MTEEKENIDNEPVEVLCDSCNEVGCGEDMIDCPRFDEDMDEKGVNPGRIHKSCCSDEFLNDPEGCLECCQDDEILSANIQEHLDECFDSSELIKDKTKNGVPIFTNKDRTFVITTHADKILEPLKPLNVIIDTFSDESSGLFYVKDNQKNITVLFLGFSSRSKRAVEKV